MADGVPDQANAGCIGPQSEMAGKADGCAGCPNQNICASGEARQVDPAVAVVNEKLSQVKHKILVLSGKGGVGKTTFACQLSFTLAQQGHQVGLLDVDICGPSVPRVMGLTGQDVHKSAAGWSPVYVDDNLGVMSIGFMLPSPDDAVIWRGPKKNGLIKQFLTDVDWGELDFLVVDTPPGTSDEHLSIIQYLKECGVDGAVVVTTPQEVAMADVRKEINFCKKTGVPVLGVVENMSGLKVPVIALRFTDGEGRERTQDVLVALKALDPALSNLMVETEVFPAFGGGPQAMAASFGVPYLGKIPLDPNLLRACDAGQAFVEHFPSSPAAASFVDIVKRVTDQLGAGNGAT